MKKTVVKKETFFYVLIRSWNAFDCFDRCIDSVLSQTYTHYQIIFVDDASDYTIEQKNHIRKKLRGHKVIFNSVRLYALRSAYEALGAYAAKDDAVVFSLDGDDWLADSKVLEYHNEIYKKNRFDATYGDCLLYKNGFLNPQPASQLLPFTNTYYPAHIQKSRAFRKYPFLPLHPLTWRVSAFKKIPKKNFMHRGKWFKYWQDLAIFLSLLEDKKNTVAVLTKPSTVYNMSHPTNTNASYKLYERIQEELDIRLKTGRQTRPSTATDRALRLSHSSLLSVPYLNSLFYFLQLSFITLLKRFSVSHSPHPLREKLLSKIAAAHATVELQHYSLGALLFQYPLKCVATFVLTAKQRDSLSEKEWYDLLWTLVVSTEISPQTKQSLKPRVII